MRAGLTHGLENRAEREGKIIPRHELRCKNHGRLRDWVYPEDRGCRTSPGKGSNRLKLSRSCGVRDDAESEPLWESRGP